MYNRQVPLLALVSFSTTSPRKASRDAISHAAPIDGIEEVQKYAVGGYHPVGIRDWLGAGDKQYRVIHKLGFGGFSTVRWVQSSVDQRYYTLKVMFANPGDDQELKTTNKLSNRNVEHANINFLLSFFHILGPNGRHLCLTFSLLGPSLKQMWNPSLEVITTSSL
ncbi:hypothetical protein F5Y05DRAFT_418513 [Hypoxylon sp. FL0543]|nr:hypothetical protein F5Y05DRAFT_418513 [Hypoxylon sp. FL0543]